MLLTESKRHKCFISYHHADQGEVDWFVKHYSNFHNVLVHRLLGMTDDVINSADTDYVMRRIRELYVKDSTVTIVLLGQCTWARRYVDWEIQSSLAYGNGLVGVVLPSCSGSLPGWPPRLTANVESGYAKVYRGGALTPDSLTEIIHEAFENRRNSGLIRNPRERFGYNRSCP